MSLREQALADAMWAASRIDMYDADAAQVPASVTRLRDLARAVLAEPNSSSEWELQMRAWIASMPKTLAEPDGPPGKGHEAAALTEQYVAPTSADPSPSATLQSTAEGAADGLRWPASLHHGLALRHVDTGVEVLFSEPVRGQYSVQSVATDRKSTGEPWSTLSERWPASQYAEVDIGLAPALPRYDAPKARKPRAPKPPKESAQDRTIALPGMADVAPAPAPPPAPKRTTIADYAPDDAQFATWTSALSKVAGKSLGEGEVRTCFVKWQTDNCNEEKPNPAASFWQHARKSFA